MKVFASEKSAHPQKVSCVKSYQCLLMLLAVCKGLSLASRINGIEAVQILHLVPVLTQDPTLLVLNAQSE